MLEVNSAYVNTVPILITRELFTLQNQPVIEQILEYTDSEGDTVLFIMTSDTLYGSANITKDGRLSFIPPEYFYGEVQIDLKLIENTTGPLEVLTSVVINIIDTNDEPVAAFVDFNDTLHDIRTPSITTLTFESNITTLHYIGRYIVLDRDEIDNITLVTSLLPSEFEPYLRIENADNDVNTTGTSVDLGNSGHIVQYNVSLETPKEFHGSLKVGLLAHDKDKYYTAPITFNIFILVNPCVHGSCHDISNGSLACSDSQRSISFKGFICTCDAGYEGDWCHVESNECLIARCPPLYDCTDHINRFTCSINPLKLSVLVLGLVTIVLFLVIAALTRKKWLPKLCKEIKEPDSHRLFNNRIG